VSASQVGYNGAVEKAAKRRRLFPLAAIMAVLVTVPMVVDASLPRLTVDPVADYKPPIPIAEILALEESSSHYQSPAFTLGLAETRIWASATKIGPRNWLEELVSQRKHQGFTLFGYQIVVGYFVDPYGVPAAFTEATETPDPGTADNDSVAAAGNTLGDRFPGGQNLLFQGLWTDPVTGISYARARWYDARNLSWLSQDPKGDVDSPNLYTPLGWNPAVFTDPMGTVLPRHALADPNTLLYKYEGKWYQINYAGLVYQIHLTDESSSRDSYVSDIAVAHGVRQSAGFTESSFNNAALHKFNEEVAKRTGLAADISDAEAELIASLSDVGGTIEDIYAIKTGKDLLSGEELGRFDKACHWAGLLPFVKGKFFRKTADAISKGVDAAASFYRTRRQVAVAKRLKTLGLDSVVGNELAAELAKLGTHGKGNTVVLGKWDEVGGYVAEAKERGATYFQTSSEMYEALGKNRKALAWAANEQFLRQQMERGVDMIDYVGENIEDVLALPGDYMRKREVQFLLDHADEYGYEFVESLGAWVRTY
jgi:RHS repeat-associated protein